ncbi:hypothetical protein KC318_g18904, partial [Hortaea werneckii]
MDDLALKQYLADSPPTVVNLAIKPHFEALNDREKKYAHYISRAALSGTRINLRQVSRESEAIYDFILTLHKSCNGDWKKLGSSAGFIGNTGNYKSFGDSKFIPRIPQDKVAALAKTNPEAEKLYNTFKDDLYESKDPARMHLGYPDKGHVSTYYPDSPDITTDEIEYTANLLKEKG